MKNSSLRRSISSIGRRKRAVPGSAISFERGEEAIGYDMWFLENIPLQYVAPPILTEWLSSFKEFSPLAKAASFTIDQAVEKLMPKD